MIKKKLTEWEHETQTIIFDEYDRKSKSKLNRTILGGFLIFCLLVLLMRVVISVLLDMGLHSNAFHLGFWSDPQGAFQNDFNEWKKVTGETDLSWTNFLEHNIAIKAIIQHHPSTFWWLTQFTWLTTIILIIFLTIRFFGMTDSVPKWLKWIMSQKTLSHVAMWDAIVGIIFWGGLASSFSEGFSNTLLIPEFILTSCVHAVIPIGIIIYAIIYAWRDKNASMLREFFAIKGLFFPALYGFTYIILTIIWDDPYTITTMHNNLIQGDGSWGKWASELWKIPMALFVIYVFLGLMTILHNLILLKANKKYDPENDFEAKKRKKQKLAKLRRKLIRHEAKLRSRKQ